MALGFALSGFGLEGTPGFKSEGRSVIGGKSVAELFWETEVRGKNPSVKQIKIIVLE